MNRLFQKNRFDYNQTDVIKRIFISLILTAMVAASAQAQHMRMPSHEAADRYAAMEKIDLTRHLPDINARKLKSFASDEAVVTANDMLSLARTFIGLRYRYGGRTPKGFDCSGFTSYVFSQFGYELKRSSREQYNSDGELVDKMQVQPGDLIFFTGRNSKSGSVGHVGIVVDGDPVTGEITFIHSACTSGITISTTDEPYYSKRFIGVKRVIK